MKVVILAGGSGSRLGNLSEFIPKPMVKIGDKPIIHHIMETYANYNHKDFYIALGFKSDKIKEYFINFKALNSDFTIDFTTGKVSPLNLSKIDWKVTLIDTGINTMTGGRLKRIMRFTNNETIMVTYGDGVANLDINKLLSFHNSHGKMITLTAVRPGARFGELTLDGNKVLSFEEKPQLNDGWVNGGYFVIEPSFINLIDGDSTLLEREPLEIAVSMGELMAYRHEGFWQCMDTKRDHELLESLWTKGAPWVK